jgi:hypothetical protein
MVGNDYIEICARNLESACLKHELLCELMLLLLLLLLLLYVMQLLQLSLW